MYFNNIISFTLLSCLLGFFGILHLDYFVVLYFDIL